MNLTVKQKLFFILASTAILSVLAITLAMNWRFNVAFNQYQAERILESLSPINQRIIQYYQEHGNLDNLGKRPRILGRWLENRQGKGLVEFDNPPERALQLPAVQEIREGRVEAPQEIHFQLRHISIIDEHQNVIIGPRGVSDYIAKRAIEYNNKTIAWMAFSKPERIETLIGKRFLNSLLFAWAITFVVIAIFILLLATLFTRHFSKPIEHLLLTIKDLTDGNYQQRSAVSSKDELGQVSNSLNTLAETLEKNEQLRQEWTANTAHELRTPITVLKGEIEAMQEGVRPMSQRNLSSLNEEIQHLEHLIEDLNSLSLADMGSLSYSMSKIDLNDAIKIAVERNQARAGNLNIYIKTQLHNLPLIQADQTRLHQLIENLIENSLRYTDAQGEIHIGTELKSDMITLLIEDTPPVPKPDELERLFEKFYRVELSRNRNTGGSGLGLSICKKIAEAHGWTIEAYRSRFGGLAVAIAIKVTKT